MNAFTSPIIEEDTEELCTDSSDTTGRFNPGVQTTGVGVPQAQTSGVKVPRMYHFPTPENFRQFVQHPASPPQTERKDSPKYVCCLFSLCLSIQNLLFSVWSWWFLITDRPFMSLPLLSLP